MITLRIVKKYEYNQREQESIPDLNQSGEDPQSYLSDKIICTISNEPGTLNPIDESPMFLKHEKIESYPMDHEAPKDKGRHDIAGDLQGKQGNKI